MKNKNFFLKLYAITLTFILGCFILSGFNSKSENEITVERINIVEPDGKLVMVISNSAKQHPGMFDGVLMEAREREPGMIFFNEEQDEVGGLIYAGNKEDGAGMVLSFDQYKNDQVMQVQYLRDKTGYQQYGLNFWDRSEKLTIPRLLSLLDSLEANGITNREEMNAAFLKATDGNPPAAERMFAGKNFEGQTGIFIKDDHGRNRINIFVDENNNPHFQILDEEGKMVKEMVE